MPSHHRLTDIYSAIAAGITTAEIHELTNIDPWFIDNLFELYEKSVWVEKNIKGVKDLERETLLALKRMVLVISN